MKTPDPVVNVLVQDLIHQLYTESNYILEFQTHFAEMKTQLNHMQSFISDADNIKEKHKTVKTTLIDLRELTYEDDDLLIDCLIRADYDTRRVSSSC
ncbi:Disease resistance RPP13-like protein 4 [Camellia lanceoleosa]|uniref:Disease resistance RPP13-like protein 4 n=1 Tax=Camellia lanceoleosa TaxID=1840588 RepID=A0ACC0H3I9_9ERIC|nr:Disease resistance RPP13-like protein 4 [Camellia lanceoleosa]